jgi:DNA-binding LytR/AlgR family response regulator
MNVLIIEDELPARAKLIDMLVALVPDVSIVGQLGSVKESLEWLSTHAAPDLAFVDIQLSDNHSFEIFRQHTVLFPVIFTTAFDKYLLESFEYNTIDYLLKPITEERLKRSLAKVKKLEQHFIQGNIVKLLNTLQQKSPQRILGKKGTDFVALDFDEIAYFFTEHKIVFAKDHHGRQLIIDDNLSNLEEVVDKKVFFRLNRKYLASLRAIEKFKPDNGKIKVFLKPEMKEDIFISKETAPAFRAWIEGN